MKKIFTIISMLVAAQGIVFAQGPDVLHYKFDGTGTSVPNLASSPPAGAATATLMGGLTQGNTGWCGGAVIGSGVASSTDYVNTGWAPDLGTGSWTISFWTSNITGTATLYYIFGDVNSNSFRCFTNGVAGPNNWILRGAGLTDVYINGGATVAPHYCTFVYDNTLANVKGYLDGTLVTTVAQGAVNVTGAGPFKVIGYATNVGMSAGGLLDEFRVYRRALSAAEVAAISPNVTSTLTLSQCDSYTSPSGNYTWTTSGTYLDTVPSYQGCDSIITIGLTVNNSSASTMTVSNCDSYTAPDGAIYTTSGTQTAVVPNFHGCDSTITINLTITNSSVSTISPVACDSYVAPDGAVYTTSGIQTAIIPNSVGCDSTITINLTVNQATSSTISPVACDSYTAPDGSIYTTSGTQTAVVPNATGCDSTITINLTVNASTTSTIAATGCGTYTAPDGAIYTTSGVQTAVVPNAAGCDSTITINLTIINVDTTLTVSPPSITANAIGSTYQWVDCASGPLAGETNQTFVATANGNYAVEVTTSGCTLTSTCVNIMNVGIQESALNNGSVVFPNPTSGNFVVTTITVADLIQVTDVLGKTIQSIQPSTTSTTIDLTAFAKGVYFVKVTEGATVESIKLIKQ